MRIVYTPAARRQIANQIGYLIDQGAIRPAKRLRTRITAFVRDFLARHPRIGRPIPEHDCYESAIPRTPYIVIYRIDGSTDTLIVLALFHGSQERSGFRP